MVLEITYLKLEHFPTEVIIEKKAFKVHSALMYISKLYSPGVMHQKIGIITKHPKSFCNQLEAITNLLFLELRKNIKYNYAYQRDKYVATE